MIGVSMAEDNHIDIRKPDSCNLCIVGAGLFETRIEQNRRPAFNADMKTQPPFGHIIYICDTVFAQRRYFNLFDIQHAMRENGKVQGVENLEGITDVGLRIENILK